MAESKSKQTAPAAEEKTTQPERNESWQKMQEKAREQQTDPALTDNPDSLVARNAGITEGDVKALRDDAGLNALAGHGADIHAWSQTPAGKAFSDAAKERDDEEEASAKSYADQFDKDGLTKAESQYIEATKA